VRIGCPRKRVKSISPYFRVVKAAIEAGFDHLSLVWEGGAGMRQTAA